MHRLSFNLRCFAEALLAAPARRRNPRRASWRELPAAEMAAHLLETPTIADGPGRTRRVCPARPGPLSFAAFCSATRSSPVEVSGSQTSEPPRDAPSRRCTRFDEPLLANITRVPAYVSGLDVIDKYGRSRALPYAGIDAATHARSFPFAG